MGHLHGGRTLLRLTLSLLLVGLVVMLLAAPVQAERFKTHRVDGNTVTDMMWGISGVFVFGSPASAPGMRTPSIDGTLVACRSGDATSPDGFNIVYRWLGGGPSAPASLWGGPGPQVQPAVSGGLIAGLDNGVVSVFDPTTGTAVPVSSGGTSPSAPAFSGDTVVWQDKTGESWDIYGRTFDRATGQPTGDVFAVCTAPGDQISPALDGDVVVWQDHRGGDWDIYGYDLAAQDEFQVASEPGDQCKPDLFGDIIAWQDSRAGNWDIYAYDLTHQETQVISRDRGAQRYPAVSSDLIVYQDEQPRYVQTNDGPTIRYTDPDIGAYSLKAHAILAGGFNAGESDRTRQTRPDVSGVVAVFQDTKGQRAPGALRVAGAKLFTLWAYSVTVQPDSYWVNSPELTFAFNVLVCPTPPVTEIGFSLSQDEFNWDDLVWEPFTPVKTVTLPAGDGRWTWIASLRDSGGDMPGAGGSDLMLDTHGPSCWAPYPVSVKSGAVATLRYRVTDKLSPGAKAAITIKRADGSVVQTVKARWIKTGQLVSRGILCDLLRGTYRIEVTATDLAGNQQVRVGTTTLTVR